VKFAREEFYGLDFSWYMVDKLGNIAILTTGYGPIPKVLFNNESNYNIINNYFENIEFITSSYLTSAFKVKQDNHIGNYKKFIDEAKKGLYSYDYQDYDGPYKLVALPNSPISFDLLPQRIKELLNLFICNEIEIPSSLELQPSDYFDSD